MIIFVLYRGKLEIQILTTGQVNSRVSVSFYIVEISAGDRKINKGGCAEIGCQLIIYGANIAISGSSAISVIIEVWSCFITIVTIYIIHLYPVPRGGFGGDRVIFRKLHQFQAVSGGIL